MFLEIGPGWSDEGDGGVHIIILRVTMLVDVSGFFSVIQISLFTYVMNKNIMQLSFYSIYIIMLCALFSSAKNKQ